VNVDLGIWSKLTRLTIFLLVVAGFLAIGVAVCQWYLPVIRQNERMRKEILRHDTLIQGEEETNRKLTAEIQAISSDPKVVERLARERLGYARTGETVIRFEAPATNTLSRVSPTPPPPR
jgi:cell division protein FtsB